MDSGKNKQKRCKCSRIWWYSCFRKDYTFSHYNTDSKKIPWYCCSPPDVRADTISKLSSFIYEIWNETYYPGFHNIELILKGYYTMENFFSLDGKFFRFINKFTSLIALNFLFIITSLPIFSIGVSFYALYQTNLKLSQNTESYIARTYFFFWRKNLKQNILLWLPVMILFIFCLINLYILPFMQKWNPGKAYYNKSC